MAGARSRPTFAGGRPVIRRAAAERFPPAGQVACFSDRLPANRPESRWSLMRRAVRDFVRVFLDARFWLWTFMRVGPALVPHPLKCVRPGSQHSDSGLHLAALVVSFQL